LEGPFERVYVADDSSKVSVALGTGHWRYTFTSRYWPHELVAEFEDVAGSFGAEIAPARTWCFEAELEALQSAGLGKGLGPESILVIGDGHYVTQERLPDEPARHKLLDVIGDLYLSGVPIAMLGVSATHSGHRLHVEAARKLAASVRIERT
jgi:UDP-3-O-acyl-N-acetylglucosamine deacetylase